MIIATRKHSYYADALFYKANKPPLLMLHGFMGCSAVFSHLGVGLSEFCSPIMLDLLGHGESDKPLHTEAYATEYQCEELYHILRSLGFEKPWILGYSMGGRLALQFAYRYPEMIQGVILESCTAGISDSLQRMQRQQEDEQRAQAIVDDFPVFLAEWNQLALFGEKQHAERALTEAFQESQLPEAMAASLRGFGAGIMPSLWESLSEINLPVGLLAGARDTRYAMLMMRMETLLPNAQLRVISHAAHRVHLDASDAYIAAIHDMIIS